MSYQYRRPEGMEGFSPHFELIDLGGADLFPAGDAPPERRDLARDLLEEAETLDPERLLKLGTDDIRQALQLALDDNSFAGGFRLFQRLRDVHHPINDSEGSFECAGARLAFLLGRGQDALALAREAVRKLRNASKPGLLAEALLIEGQVLLGHSRLESAVVSLNGALHIYQWDVGDIEGSIRVSNLLALVHKRRGKWVVAEDVLERALSITQEHGLTDARLRILSNLAVLRLKLGKTAEAVASLNELALSTPEKLRMPEANGTLTWAILDRMRGRFIAARRRVRRVLRWARRNGFARTEILCYEYLADARHDEGYPLLAMKLLNMVFRVTKEKYPNTDLVCEVQRRRAEVLAELGKRGHARRAADHALMVAEHIGEPFEIALAHRARGLVHLAFGDVASAMRELNACEDGLRELGEKFELGRTLLHKAGILIQQGGFEAGSEKLEEARRIFLVMGLDFWGRRSNQGGLLSPRKHPFRN